nr:sulfatase-like hydrolase/transferase [Candidatus Cloacimonadota bacterium]
MKRKTIDYFLSFLVISGIAGLSEFLILYLSSLQEAALLWWNLSSILQNILSCCFVWFIILFLLRLIIDRTQNFILPIRLLFNFILIFILFFLILLDIASWKFFLQNRSFLTWDSLIFALSNLSLFINHLASSDLSGLLKTFIITLFSSILLFGCLLATLHNRTKNTSAKIISAVFLVSILAAFIFGTKISHPFTALFIKNSTLPEMSEKELIPYLHPKQDIFSFSCEPDSTHPVIIIMIESMRRDLYYSKPSPIPFMKQLADESFFFDRSYASSTHSDYSDLAFWYSRYPLRYKSRTFFKRNSPNRGLSIFEYFHNSGYQTAYISSQNEYWGNMINWLQDKGIDYFYHSENYSQKTWVNEDDENGLSGLIENTKATAGKIPDAETLSVAKSWIDGLEDKHNFLLGMNLQNTHFDYFIPENSKRPFQPDGIDFPAIYGYWSKDKAEQVKNTYKNAFYNLDSDLADFVEFLKEKNIWQNCFLVILGDSGEAFYEHDFANHSSALYDEAARTFTMIKTPAGAHKIIYKTISHIDVLPILLNLMHLPVPDSFQGFVDLSIPAERSVFIHNNAIIEQNALISWPWKLLETVSSGQNDQLFNLADDPDEQRNLIGQETAIADSLKNRLNLIENAQFEYYRNSR